MITDFIQSTPGVYAVVRFARGVYESLPGVEQRRRRIALLGAMLMMLQVVCCCCPLPITLSGTAAGLTGAGAVPTLCQRITCHAPGR